MNQETDTPQTSEIETAYEQQRESVGGIIEHARELERELNAAKAEIARLTEVAAEHKARKIIEKSKQ